MQNLSASAITTRLRAYWLLALLAHCAPPPLELLPPRPFLPPPPPKISPKCGTSCCDPWVSAVSRFAAPALPSPWDCFERPRVPGR